MNGFFGQYEKALDAKGRVVIPNEFRSLLETDEKEFVLSKWFEGALALFPKSTWHKLADRVHRQGIGNPKIRSARRLLLAAAYPVSLDGQGRLIIPPQLTEFAQLKKDLILLGDWDKIEIWDKGLFAKTELKENANINETFSAALADAYHLLVNDDIVNGYQDFPDFGEPEKEGSS